MIKHITVTGTGDKQTGFCRNGNYFKASIDARKSSCEAFFRLKILRRGGIGQRTEPRKGLDASMKVMSSLESIIERRWEVRPIVAGSSPAAATKITGFNLFTKCYGVKRQALAAGVLPTRPEKAPHDCLLPESDQPDRLGSATLTRGEIPQHKIRR